MASSVVRETYRKRNKNEPIGVKRWLRGREREREKAKEGWAKRKEVGGNITDS